LFARRPILSSAATFNLPADRSRGGRGGGEGGRGGEIEAACKLAAIVDDPVCTVDGVDGKKVQRGLLSRDRARFLSGSDCDPTASDRD